MSNLFERLMSEETKEFYKAWSEANKEDFNNEEQAAKELEELRN